MAQFHFIRPWWLLALLPILFFLWQLLKKQVQAGSWQAVCDEHLLPQLLDQYQQGPNRWPYYILAVIWLLTVLALTGPTWTRLPQPVYRAQSAVVVAMDMSQTMYAKDLPPSRLERERFKAMDLLKLATAKQVGMVAFSREAYVVSPLTNDTHTISEMVPQLTPNIMPVSGQNIKQALIKSAALIKQGGDAKGQIVLFTSAQATASDMAQAAKLEKEGITTSVLGIGTLAGAPIPTSRGFYADSRGDVVLTKLHETSLQALAKAGGGHYQRFNNNDSDVRQLLNGHATSLTKATKMMDKTDIWKDEGRWLLWLVLPLLLLGFRRGWFEEILKP